MRVSYQKDYVVGFAFDAYGSVALIQKQRPTWQKGKWNGIGGSREQAETGSEAMAREFYEETGMRTKPEDWKLVGKLKRVGSYRCLVYVARFPLLSAHTVTDEVVRIFTTDDQLRLGDHIADSAYGYAAIHNIPALLALCTMSVDTNTGVVPMFELDYSGRSHP
jgi:8-oxo-dGTP pyrophosphatase MutT (NUDIX family)